MIDPLTLGIGLFALLAGASLGISMHIGFKARLIKLQRETITEQKRAIDTQAEIIKTLEQRLGQDPLNEALPNSLSPFPPPYGLLQ